MSGRWLLRDQVGYYSGIVYGRKGDKVELIGHTNIIMALVKSGNEFFHVRAENLTDKEPAAELIETIVPEQKPAPPQLKQFSKSRSKKITGKSNPPGIQKPLF